MTKHRFFDGTRKAWIVSAKLNVPESFEPNMVFVEDTTDIISSPSNKFISYICYIKTK